MDNNDTQIDSEDLVVVLPSSTEDEYAAGGADDTNVVGSGVVDVEERPDPPVVTVLREMDSITRSDTDDNTSRHNSNSGEGTAMIQPPPPPITLRSGEEVNAKNTLQSHSIVEATTRASPAGTASRRLWVADQNVDEAAALVSDKNDWLLNSTVPVVRQTNLPQDDPDLFASAMVLGDDDIHNGNRTLGPTPLAPILLPAPIIQRNIWQQTNIEDSLNIDVDGDIESPDNVAAVADDKVPTDNRALASSKRWIIVVLLIVFLILAIVSVAVVAGVCGTGGCGSRSSPQIVVITTAPSAATVPVDSNTDNKPPVSDFPNQPVIPSTTASSPTPTSSNPSTTPVLAPVAPTLSPTELTPYPTVLVPPPTTTTSPPMEATSPDNSPTVNSSTALYQPPINIAQIPKVEDGFLYSASYVGQFQYVRDTSCYGPTNPDIRVYCSGEVKPTGRSDKRIACNEILPDSEAYIDSFNGIACTTNCTDDDDTECNEIFINQDKTLGGPPFGQIYFQCSGSTLAEISPVFLYGDYNLDEYGCNFSANDTSTRNYHIVRMGVSCPTEIGTGQEYVFDEYYSDCFSGSADTFSTQSISDFNFCFSGENCAGQDCDFTMYAVAVNAQVQNFQDRCVASLEDITTLPTMAPVNFTAEAPLISSALFQARWGVLMDSDTSNATIFDCFAGGPPTIRINCPNSEIELVNESFPETTVCTALPPGVLECIDNGDLYLTEFTSVTYRCTGALLPTTSVEYQSSNAYCENNTVAVHVRHAAQVGVYCGSYDEFLFAHFYLECDGLSAEFENRNGINSNYSAYTCSQSVEFPIGSTSDIVQTVPSLLIGTDENWLSSDDDSCFTLAANGDQIGTRYPTSAPLAPLFQGIGEGLESLAKVGGIGGAA